MRFTRREFLALSPGAGLGLLARPRPPSGGKSPVAGRAGSSVEGEFAADIVAAETSVPLGTGRASLLAFNGQVPGPLFEFEAGADVRLRLHNQLTEPTNLHFHGLHVSPTDHADNVFTAVPPGETFDYAFRIPSGHPAGLFWLHPHLHGSAARQVSLGLAAPCVIRGTLDRIPEITAAREHFLILQDFLLDRFGRSIDPGAAAVMAGREGPLVTVNGVENPQYPIEQDGLLRLRLLNASVSRFYRLALEGHPLHVVASDGGSLPAPLTVPDLLLAPGARADVLIQGTQRPGSYRLVSLPYDRGGMGMMGPRVEGSVTLATVTYDGRAARRVPLPSTLVDVPSLPEPTRRRTFRLSQTMGMMPGRGMGMRFLINGRAFERDRVDDRVRLGAVEEWEYVNDGPMDHPMHLHTNAVQVVGPDGRPERAWRDVVVVPAQSRVRVRLRFDDFVGTTVHHCHILDHEDLGMMATLAIES